MSIRQVRYFGGPADGHITNIEEGETRRWIPRPVKRVRTCDGNFTPFVEALTDAEMGFALLDAALFREATLHAEWVIEDEVTGVYVARGASIMQFYHLGILRSERMAIAQLGYRRLAVFLLREAAIEDGVSHLVGGRDDDFVDEISLLFPLDDALILRARETRVRRAEFWSRRPL